MSTQTSIAAENAANAGRTIARRRTAATHEPSHPTATISDAPAPTTGESPVADHVTRSLRTALAGVAQPTKAQIRDRAYFIYIARSGAPGNAENDWLQAEAELRAEQHKRLSS